MVMTDDEPVTPGVLRPKDAATLVLVRRDPDAPRVLMGCRPSGMAFMANKYVFPGGRMDACDQRLIVTSELRPDVMARLSKGVGSQRARGLALAAVRETFEETGVLVGEYGPTPRTRSPVWSKFFAQGVAPRLDRLEFIARAITPPNRTRRFDARFFMADASAIAHALPVPEHHDLLRPSWLTLSEARRLDVPAITLRILEEVEDRLAENRAGDRPVPFFRFIRGKTVQSAL